MRQILRNYKRNCVKEFEERKTESWERFEDRVKVLQTEAKAWLSSIIGEVLNDADSYKSGVDFLVKCLVDEETIEAGVYLLLGALSHDKFMDAVLDFFNGLINYILI